MRTVFITGANRGIGLEFARQYARAGDNVIAACRTPTAASALAEIAEKMGSIEIIALDVADEASVQALNTSVDGRNIDILINNAGVSGRSAATFDTLDFDAFADTLNVNAIGPMRVIAALKESVARSDEKKIINISSDLGGISEARGGHYAYRASKAALNMLTKAFAEDLKPQGVIAAAFHPGWVQTDMGGPHALISSETSVTQMRAAIASLSLEQSGAFLRFDGARLAY